VRIPALSLGSKIPPMEDKSRSATGGAHKDTEKTMVEESVRRRRVMDEEKRAQLRGEESASKHALFRRNEGVGELRQLSKEELVERDDAVAFHLERFSPELNYARRIDYRQAWQDIRRKTSRKGRYSIAQLKENNAAPVVDARRTSYSFGLARSPNSAAVGGDEHHYPAGRHHV
jgi:hypothetical protein